MSFYLINTLITKIKMWFKNKTINITAHLFNITAFTLLYNTTSITTEVLKLIL